MKCEHDKLKTRCVECYKLNQGGGSICEHERRRSNCTICNIGGEICVHKKRKIRCVECTPTYNDNKCIHDIRKYRCVRCTSNTKEVCISCRLFRVLKQTNYLCSYCNENNKVRTKENRVKELLDNYNINYINNKEFNNDCCLKYRPDFLIDCITYYLVIECDENAHNGYEKECELIRMNNISIGLGLPTKFIRYNPDKYGISQELKEKTLIETIGKYTGLEYINDIEPVYLFY